MEAFAGTAEALALAPYERHFLDAVRGDMQRGGLALLPEARVELQALLGSDAEGCNQYKAALLGDDTSLTFTR